MARQKEWTPVVRFGLRGKRFDGSVTIGDLAELENFQLLIRETAASVWRREHPQRLRLPKGFERATELRFSQIEKGSSIVPLEAQVHVPAQQALFGEIVEGDEIFAAVRTAIELTWMGVGAGARGERVPDRVPREHLPKLGNLGSTLGSNEQIEVTPIDPQGRRHFDTAVLDSAARQEIERQVPGRYEDAIVVQGHITAADVTSHRFRIHLDDGRELAAAFSPAQERTVTGALRDHDSIAVEITGQALYEADGRPHRVIGVENMKTLTGEASLEGQGGLWASLAAFGKERAVGGLPRDLATNLDAYLYDPDK